MQHKRGNRIVFYLNDEEVARLEQAVEAASIPRADYLREVLENAIRGAAVSTGEGTFESTAGALREAQATYPWA